MTFSSVPDAAIGAIAAASIAGLLAFLGLIAAKENKTSEFRQAWIDALRLDLSKLISNARAIRGAVAVGYDEKSKLFDATEKFFIEINQVAVAIRLRVNPEEEACQLILAGIAELERLMIDCPAMDLVACRACEEKIIEQAQILLKSEWTRVRRGELIFVLTKWIGFFVISVGLGLLIWSALQSSNA